MKFLTLFKSNLIPLAILFVVNFLIKIPFTSQGFFAFTFDQGRDLLVIARMIYEGKLTLIGPTTGLQGIFYGPTWYYLLAPLLYISGGNPQGVADFIGVFAIVTIFAIYLLLKYLTSDNFISLSLALVASMSNSWMFAPTIIWSPTIVTFLMVLLICSLQKIFASPKPVYYFALGALTILIGDGGAAFGAVMTIALLISPFIFKKEFFKKEFLLSILGALVAVSPRIIFDLKHNFLITRSLISYIYQPKVYGEHESILTRFVQKLDLFWGIFSQAFARNNKILGLVIIILIFASLLIIFKKTKLYKQVKEDKLFHYLLFLLVTLLIAFSIFPDIVWDYYLVGLPIIFLTIIARILYVVKKDKIFWQVSKVALSMLVILNFNKGLLAPYKITWLGEGATYRNQKMVMDYIAGQNPHDYSFYAYTPAIFDYPFDYLVYWYSRQGKIEAPKEKQKLMFLVIRDFSNKKYLTGGWYGDKTRDNTNLLERKEFIGDLLVEKHETR